ETQYRYFHGLKTGINIPEAVKGTYNFLAALRKDMEGESIHKLGLAVGGIYIDGYQQVFTVHFGNPNHPSSSSIELKPLDRDSGLLIAKKSDTYGLNPVEYSLDLSTNELSIKKKIGDSTESTVRKPGFEGGNDGLYSEALRELISILNDVEKGNIQPPYFNDSPAYKLAANQINEYLGILLNYGKQIELPLYYAYPIVAYESAPFGKAHDQNSNHPSGENVMIFTARGHKTLKTVVYEAYGEKPVSYALDLETGKIRTKKVEAPQVELINDLMPPRQGGDRATYIAAIDAMIKTVDFVAEPKLETVAAYLASIRREILDSSL
ncbi:MAG: hypothetical protein NTX25_02865, partial [Proteobacteria bacterium]|nr:hypothetical protein [Pseudomonadota bacterium]